MSQTRQLAAIMFTDIVGYTKLVEKSESSALELSQRHREVFELVTQEYEGKIINYYGDGTLSIFKSTVNAVKCAVELQKCYCQKPVVPFRIGIHTGDIILTESDIIGDSVNLASRIESLGNQVKTFGYSVGSIGGISAFRIYPKEKVIIVMVSNSSNTKYGNVVDRIVKMFLE